MKTVEQTIFEMLTECTGQALCDSGGAYGWNWEWNQNKTLKDFQREPEVSFDVDDDGNFETYTISVFHYLTKQLELDEICQGFNRRNKNADNWNDERFYGVSDKAGKYLDKYNVKEQGGFNSYNGEDFLSQVIQGTYCQIADNSYVILQIHGGCDVRGGYTNARLFKVTSGYEGWLCPQDVFGVFTPNNADLKAPALIDGVDVAVMAGVIQFDNSYDGYNLADENGHKVELNINKGKIEMFLGF